MDEVRDEATNGRASEKQTHSQHEQPSLLQAVTEALARGATVLTANQRAARTLQHRIDQQNSARGLTSWEPPSILSWDAWLNTQWRRIVLAGEDQRLLLTSAQEHHLWSSIIAADSSREWSSLQGTDALARLAADAWSRLCAYRGLARIPTLDVSKDSRACKRWLERFTRRCQSEGYLSSAALESAVAASVEARGRPTSETSELYLVGFDSTTPSQEALLAAVEKRETAVVRHHPAASFSCYLQIAQDADSELQSAANWLRDLLAQPASSPGESQCSKPNAEASPAEALRIAVIHPSLGNERGEIDRIFRRTLAPLLVPIDADSSTPSQLPYEFSLGVPLSRAPMLIAALDLIRWMTTPLTLRAFSRLLLAPSFCPVDEYEARAEFEAFVLRRAKILRPEFNLESILTTLQSRSGTAAAPLRPLLRQLQALQHTAQRLQLKRILSRTYTEWADAMRQILDAADWAPSQSLDRDEFQLKQKWERGLDELATLDFAGDRATFDEALTSLETILGATLFAPQSRNAPVQIMGPLEAAGSEFDAVWFLRANEAEWPSRPATSPLLGWQVQRQLRMPGADAALDQDYARRVTERIAGSAPLAVFSSATQTPEGHQRPSPLLRDFETTALDISSQPPQRAHTLLEELQDGEPIPLTDLHVKGGADLLKAQAACPFRAFAERRLGSTELDDRPAGFNAAERGNLVHVTLQHLWEELRDKQSLQSLSPDERTAAIDHAIRTSLHGADVTATSPWEHAYLALQREILHNLMDRWLSLELSRKVDFTVKLREHRLETTVGPLHLDLRFDRIDETSHGDVLIDYKTGLARPRHWFGERPEEPQLPLYAVLSESSNLAAVAFALLRPGKEMQLHGISTTKGILSKQDEFPAGLDTIDRLVEHWQQILIRLAQDFAAGDARVHPKQASTCKYCAQNLLCRIEPGFFEHQPSDDADPEQAEDETEPAR